MKIKVFMLPFFLLVFLLFSCSAKDESSVSEVPHTNSSQTVDPLLPNLDIYNGAKNKYVVVLMGYGYNEGDEKTQLIHALDEHYGLYEKEGIIIPFTYPDDFVSFGYERISLLPNNIEDALFEVTGSRDLSQVGVLLTIGAPEGAHYALANLQDSVFEGQIFSVFSQDDILGTEAGSTLVIDYSISQSAQEEGLETLGEIDLSYPDDVFNVVSPLINAGLLWNDLGETGLFVSALRSSYARNTECDFYVYIDPQTGLRSENHYVLTQKESE